MVAHVPVPLQVTGAAANDALAAVFILWSTRSEGG